MIPTKKQDGEGISTRKQKVTEASPSRVVPKPIPQSQVKDARSYQIDQLKRRFVPKETTLSNSTTTTSLAFKLAPSDPDFPFELDHLECDLHIPGQYPKAPPTLHVRNQNIPRGFGINIERGWDRLVQEKPGATLLALTNALDKNLEHLLSEQKAETVKVTIFKDTRHLDRSAEEKNVLAPTVSGASIPAAPPTRFVAEDSFTKEQITEAKARRAQETRQLESRMARDPLYHKSSDGVVYTLPLEPKRRSDLPVGLQTVKSFQLIIPLLYPLQAIRILLNDVESKDAELTEELFLEKVMEKRQLSLMGHTNYLTQSLHILCKQAQSKALAVVPSSDTGQQASTNKVNETPPSVLEDAKSHIQVIPRPPEWGYAHDSESSDEYDSDNSDESEDGGATIEPEGVKTSASTSQPEHGTAISFPSVELHGIELLQVTMLSLSVKCDRCKHINDVGSLKHDMEKRESCAKCATPLTIKFRPELVHQNSTRAGFIDVSGCSVADMLPSTFVPTCGTCSMPSHGLVSVRGETTTNVCRECHARITFKIPEVKFLAYSPGSGILPPTTGPRRKVARLGLHAGEALPDRGACAHYKKSYRWFRFSCCSKVYACDRCHDEAENHVNEWASRMICGWCSREQKYSVDSCAFCGRSVIGRKGKGYWEGGKGTRDRKLMRRGDKRKHRRVGGGEAKKAAAE